MTIRVNAVLSGLAAGAVILGGCASKEEPARNAVNTVETNLSQVRDDAAKFAPDALESAQTKVDALKRDLDQHHYTQVLARAQAVNTEVLGLHDVVVSAQTQQAAAAREWDAQKEEVPKMLAAIQIRVDHLKGSKLPKEVKKESFEAAKASLESMKSLWAEATQAFDAGKASEATDKARQVQMKGKEVYEQLGMTPA